MKFLRRKNYVLNTELLCESDYYVLDYEQLLLVNGAGSSPNSTASTSSSSTTNSNNTDNRGYPSSTAGYNTNAPSNITVNPRYSNQKDFSEQYGEKFGNNACAATSLLNEISEQYTRETGHALPVQLRDAAMAAAVNSGSINSENARVEDWTSAANMMAQAVGLEGNYTYKH